MWVHDLLSGNGEKQTKNAVSSHLCSSAATYMIELFDTMANDFYLLTTVTKKLYCRCCSSCRYMSLALKLRIENKFL